MLRLFASAAGVVAFLAVMMMYSFQPGFDLVELSTGDSDDPQARDEIEFLIQRDPVANEVPRDIHRREVEFVATIPTRESLALSKGNSLQSLTWVERGPNNVGGRTRVLAADIANPGTLIAGSVAGGIWKTTDALSRSDSHDQLRCARYANR